MSEPTRRASAARASFESVSSHRQRRQSAASGTRPPMPPLTNGESSRISNGRYDISSIIHDPSSSASLLPSLPSLSQNSYLPTQITSLGTTFTSAGTLPRSAAAPGKSVVQRRSQAPPLQVSELKKVGKEEFEPYLREIADEYDRWIKETRTAAREDGDDEGQDALVKESKTSRKKRKEEEQLPSLDQVPAIFFDPTFNLSNPRTFDLVTERIQVTHMSSPSLGQPSSFSPGPPSPQLRPLDGSTLNSDVMPGLGPSTLNELAADELLQDKLSHFTAVIESHLVREIGLRSSSFFAALSNLQHLHQQGQDAIAKIEELRTILQNPESGVNGTAKHGLRILRSQARRRGLEKIEEAVRAVEEVSSALEGVRELVENGEWEAALEVAEQIEEAYYGSAAAANDASPAVAARSNRRLSLPSSASNSALSRSSLPLNLTKLTALRGLPSKLSLMRQQIAKSLEGELISVLEHEMDVGVEEGIARMRRAEGNGDGEPTQGEEDQRQMSERARDRVMPVVRALVRSEGMDSAVQAWRESVLREVRALVREHLPTTELGDKEDEDPFASAAIRSVSKQSVDLGTISDKSLSLAKKLRAMPHEAFLALARETYRGLLACIEVVDLQATILLELSSASRDEERARKARRRRSFVSNGTEPPKPPTSNGTSSLAVPGSDLAIPSLVTPSPLSPSNTSTAGDDASTLSTEITDVLAAVTELANVRFSKVIGVRSEVHAQLALAEFLDVFDSTWDFVLRCEVLAKRMIVGLRGAMVSQAKTWLASFHQRRITESARVVEEEQWSAAEVPRRVQTKVGWIVEGAMTDPARLMIGARRNEPAESGTNDATETEETMAKQLEIEGKQFFAVQAGLTTIESLVEYLQVVLNCPMLTTDAMSKVIEFMKVFNSRSCQVVLGAGAMRSAGLKNITAKNLALASQALSIMVSLIPYIRELIRRHLNPKQAVMLTEFDKLKRDYQEHQYEIHSKLVAIMSDRLIVHSRTLEAIDWEEPSSRPGQPNVYMESLTKEHLTLYKVLSRFLHTETVFSIMSQVFSALDSRLSEEFGKVEFQSEAAKERALVDVRWLGDKLSGLKGLEETSPGKAIEETIVSKSLPPPPAAKPPNGPTLSARPPPGAAAVAVDTPLPATPSLATSQPASASASTLSLALPDAPSTPRTSLEAPSAVSSPPIPRARSPSPGPTPPSPVPIPAPLPPSPQLAGPAPYKRKTLAERLAERMGRKPVEPVPPQQPLLDIPKRVGDPVQTAPGTGTGLGLGASVSEQKDKRDEDARLLDEVQREVPTWTPKGEKELEAVEKEIEQEVLAEQQQAGETGQGAEPATVDGSHDGDTALTEGPSRTDADVAIGEAEPSEGREEDERERPDVGTTEERIIVDQPPSNPTEPIRDATTAPEVAPAQSVGAEMTVQAAAPAEEPQPREQPSPDESTSTASATKTPTDQSEPSSTAVQPDIAPEPARSADWEAEHEPRLEGAAPALPSVPARSTEAEPLAAVTVESPSAGPSVPDEKTETATAALASPSAPPAADSHEPRAAATSTLDVEAASPPAAAPTPAPAPSAISAQADPPPPSTPVSSPPPTSVALASNPTAPTSPPSGPMSPTTATRKKTLKERLAEAARRGSTGNTLVNVGNGTASPRTSVDVPTTVNEEAPKTVVARPDPSRGEVKDNEAVKDKSPTEPNLSPAHDGTVRKDSTPTSNIVNSGEGRSAQKPAENEVVEEEQAAFL
ncbi:hypothetical protein JCM10212_006018 [Sporobolomyces blumeae]